MVNLLFKNELKLFKRRASKMLKNHYIFFGMFAAVLIYGVFNYKKYILNFRFLDKYSAMIFPGLLILVMAYGFIERKSVFKIYHANIFYLDDKEKNILIKFNVIKTIAIYMVLSCGLGYFLGGERILKSAYIFVILLLQYILSIYSYNLKNKWIPSAVRIFTLFMIFSLYLWNVLNIPVLLTVVAEIVILMLRFRITDFDRNLFYEEMKIYDRIQSAGRSNNFSEMEAINNEFKSIKGRRYTYLRNLNKRNAIFEHLVLSLRRSELKTVVTIGILCCFGIAANRIILKNNYITMFLVFSFLVNVGNIFVLKLKRLLEKEKMGLFFDYDYIYVVKNYFAMNFIFNTVFLLLCAVVYGTLYFRFMIIDILYLPMLMFYIYFSGKSSKKFYSYVNSIYLILVLVFAFLFL